MNRLEYYILLSHFPHGSRIVLDKTSIGGIPYNASGRVLCIYPDMNLISVVFDSGMHSSLIYGQDMFHRETKYISHR